jgi:lipopolysaccharide biosynthesis regulator YciM
MEQSFSFEFLLIVALFIALSLGASYVYYDKKRGRKKEDLSYQEGLKFMAEGENRRAIEKFKEAVRNDSGNIDAYLKIGIILRSEGLTNNAIRIHKDLLLRGNLSEEDLTEVNKNLAIDYWEAGNLDTAERYFNELKENKTLFTWTVPYLLRIYEMRQDWKSAIALYEDSKLGSTKKGKSRLAMYKVNFAENLIKENDEKAARIIYKEAIKLDKSCAEAYLKLGDSYLREERATDAIAAWNNLCKNVPEKAHLAFERLEKTLYEKGQFSKIEELYSGILAENEDDIHAILALSNIYRKKGEYDIALKLLQQAQKRDVDENLIKAARARVLIDKSQFEEAAKLAMEIIEEKKIARGSTLDTDDEDIQS